MNDSENSFLIDRITGSGGGTIAKCYGKKCDMIPFKKGDTLIFSIYCDVNKTGIQRRDVTMSLFLNTKSPKVTIPFTIITFVKE